MMLEKTCTSSSNQSRHARPELDIASNFVERTRRKTMVNFATECTRRKTMVTFATKSWFMHSCLTVLQCLTFSCSSVQ